MAGEIYTLVIIAVALGMDAFSVSLGIGMLKLRLRKIFHIGIQIGAFHILMPLIGMLAGKFLSNKFGMIASYIGGTLLILLGIQMIISSFSDHENMLIKPVGIGLFLFGFSVSIDSLAVGLTLGIFGAKMIVVLICFGSVTAILTWLGLLLGRRVQGFLGNYSVALGGCLMLTFGLKLLFW